MRDNFTKSTRENLAKRVNGRCSNPNCRKPTFGPKVELFGAMNIGVAAHISAAAPGGPRYDEGSNTSKRISPENGIWLCQNCAKLIDNDQIRYDVELLKNWKISAEHEALAMLESNKSVPERLPDASKSRSIAGMSNQDTPAMAYLEFARLENIQAKWEDAEGMFDACRIMTDGAGKKICWEVVEIDKHNATVIDQYFAKFKENSLHKMNLLKLEFHFISIVACGDGSGENEQLAHAIYGYCNSCNNTYGIRVLIGFMARNRYVDLVLTGA